MSQLMMQTSQIQQHWAIPLIGSEKPEHMKSAAEHNSDIKQSLEWLATEHLGYLMAMRLVIEPLRLLLLSQFQCILEV